MYGTGICFPQIHRPYYLLLFIIIKMDKYLNNFFIGLNRKNKKHASVLLRSILRSRVL